MRGKKRKITKRRKSLKSLLTKPPSLISWRTGLSIINKIECKITHSKEKKQKKGAKKSFVTVILSVSLSMSLFEKKTQLREHLISSQFFSKRNAFRNGGRGVALVSDGKSQIAHFPQKRKIIDFEETFEVRIERKCPALSLLKPRAV